MKWYRVLAMVLTGILSFNSYGQTSILFPKSTYIIPYELEVTENKTTHLVFPSAITSIDRGSEHILVEKVHGVDNILKVKAGARHFAETNLTVVSNDGKLYPFIVTYSNHPAYLNISIQGDKTPNEKGLLEYDPPLPSSISMGEQELKIYSKKVASSETRIHSVYDESSRMFLALTGFFVKDDAMFCRLEIENYSNINYDVDQFRLYIRDKKQSKRTATQEIEVKPLLTYGNSVKIKGKSKETLVIAVPKFTIPYGKYLAIEIMEKNGGRNLSVRIKNRHVVKARGL